MIGWLAGSLALFNYYRDEELLRVVENAYRLLFAEHTMGGRIFPFREDGE